MKNSQAPMWPRLETDLHLTTQLFALFSDIPTAKPLGACCDIIIATAAEASRRLWASVNYRAVQSTRISSSTS